MAAVEDGVVLAQEVVAEDEEVADHVPADARVAVPRVAVAVHVVRALQLEAAAARQLDGECREGCLRRALALFISDHGLRLVLV